MPETTCGKLKRRCLPFTYACSFSHIKSVLIGTVTEYESKFFHLRKIKSIENIFFCVILSTKNYYYSFLFNSINMSFCTITYFILCIRLFNVL
jgi:hypothetical protein